MYYKKTVKDVFEEFSTNEYGLSNEEAKNRLQSYGSNIIIEKEAISVWKIVINQFKSPLIYILVIAAVFTTLIEHYIDTGVILAAVLLNTIIGFFQEYKAEKAMQAIKKLAAPKATVIREGKEDRINSEDIVPGDIVILSAGNKIPADIRLIRESELNVDESTLTGESMPVDKNTEVISQENVPIADRKNMAFMGTIATHGSGRGVVVRTGEKTQLGKISQQIKTTEKERTPLQKRLADFSRKIGMLSIGLSLFVFIVGIIKGLAVTQMAVFAISMAVAVIPEGLPVVVTITMAIGLNRMAKKNAIIRQLIAVETLGGCNYICSDKTGTITENKMTVIKAYIKGKNFEFKGIGYKPEGEILLDSEKIQKDDNLYKLLLSGLLCNDSNLYEENGVWNVDGDPTEGALIVSAAKYGIDVNEEEYKYKRVDELPFSSKKQYMVTMHQIDDKYTIFVKGSPEKILGFSGNEDNRELNIQSIKMAEAGLRVLGFGMKQLNATSSENINLEKEATEGLDFLGFQGIIDPPKESAIEAIKGTKEAGIKTVMITGDHKETATVIAKRIGIFGIDSIAVTGQELDSKGENFLKDNVEKISVYARVSPRHKLEIVEALQDKGNVVAVTGDGVNDAPALKKANIGVSMGKGGTDVAKEASDMILKDDNYASIFEAVKVGRIIFDNIQKVVFFLLGTAVGEALIIISSLFIGLPLPFLATQILWINLVTNGLQDVALAYEPGEEDIAKRPPRDPKERIISSFLLKRLIIVGVVVTIGTLFLFWYKLSQGHTLTYARTTAFNTIVFYQFFHTLNSRSFEKSVFKMSPFANPFLYVSLILSLIAQISVLTFAPLQYIFGTTELDAETWIQTIFMSLTIIVAMEIDKLFRKRPTMVEKS